MKENLRQGKEASGGALYWRSRRGMAEVELKLLPFLEGCIEALDDGDRQAYARLLEAEDWQLHDWLQGRSEPPDLDLARIVGLIRCFDRKRA